MMDRVFTGTPGAARASAAGRNKGEQEATCG